MAGIVAALKAHNDVGLLRQPIDDLALPFVAPLGADNDNVGHSRTIPFANLTAYAHDLSRKGGLQSKTKPTTGFPGPCFSLQPSGLNCDRAARMQGNPTG